MDRLGLQSWEVGVLELNLQFRDYIEVFRESLLDDVVIVLLVIALILNED